MTHRAFEAASKDKNRVVGLKLRSGETLITVLEMDKSRVPSEWTLSHPFLTLMGPEGMAMIPWLPTRDTTIVADIGQDVVAVFEPVDTMKERYEKQVGLSRVEVASSVSIIGR